MSEAVAHYDTYRAGGDAWALGRFIIPVTRLDEFAGVLLSRPSVHSFGDAWQLSALVGGSDFAGDLVKADAFNRSHRGIALIDTVEFKASTTPLIEAAARLVGKRFTAFHEIPLGRGADLASGRTSVSLLRELLETISRVGGSAKVRTGGVTAEAFPEPTALGQFLEQCAAAHVPFKATAGLHHSIRGDYPLTYESGSPSAIMHGFLNVLVGAAFARVGWKSDQLAEVLSEQAPSAFRFDVNSVSWRGHRLTSDALRGSRSQFLISFGSCSFEEPIRDLYSPGWLPE